MSISKHRGYDGPFDADDVRLGAQETSPWADLERKIGCFRHDDDHESRQKVSGMSR
jgi:hypothetical protein